MGRLISRLDFEATFAILKKISKLSKKLQLMDQWFLRLGGFDFVILRNE